MITLSRYSFFILYKETIFLYNIASGKAMALHPRLFKIIQDSAEDLSHVNDIHPDLYKELCDSGYVVDSSTNESDALIEKYKSMDSDPRKFSMTINPTLDCNLRCWYCYEDHLQGTMMDSSTMEKVKKLILNKLADERIEFLDIQFFGGEPLLGWKKTIEPLLSFAVENNKSGKIKLHTGFTTNGVLLFEKILNRLNELGFAGAFFQISIDGNREIHDNSRVGINKKPTYDTILNNAKMCAKLGFHVILRFNYTPENIDSFLDVIANLDDVPQESRHLFDCNFQKVWQSGELTDFIKDKINEMIEIMNSFKLF